MKTTTMTAPHAVRCTRFGLAFLSLGMAAAMGASRSSHAGTGLLDLILERATQARDRAIQARDVAKEARNSAEEIRDRVRDGAEALTGSALELLTSEIDRMHGVIDDTLTARQEFELGPCETVRGNLVSALEEMEYIGAFAQDLVTCQGGAPLVDFSAQIATLESVPCSVLLPFPELSPCLVERLQDGGDALALIANLEANAPTPVAREGDGPTAAWEAELEASRFWLEHYNAVMFAQHQIDAMATGLQFLGKVLKALGETNFKTTIGIHGYAQVVLDSNMLKRLAAITDAIAGVMEHNATTIKDRMTRCVDRSIEAQHLLNQMEFLRNQQILMQQGSVGQ